MRNWKINTKLTFMFLVVGLVPVLLSSFCLLFEFSFQARQQKMLELKGRNGSKKFQIEQWYQERMTDIGVLATNEEYGVALARLQEARTGGEVSTSYDEFRRELDVKSTRFCRAYGYDDLALVNVNGEAVYSSHYDVDTLASFDSGAKAGSPWAVQVQDALKGVTTVSDLHSYGRHGLEEMKLYFMAPLRARETIIGVIALGVHAEKLSQFMTASAGMGRSGESFIVGEDRLLRTKRRVGDGTGLMDTRADTEDVALAFEGQSGVSLNLDYRGQLVYAAYDALDVPGLRWAVITKIDQVEAMEHIYDMRMMVTALLITLAVGLAVVAIFFSRSISRPLRLLTSIARRMAEGEIDQETPSYVNRRDELGQLAAAFNVLMNTNRSLVTSVAAVADGALDSYVPSRGEHDLLAMSVNHMIDALRQTASQAELIAQGDLGCKTVIRSERDQLGLAIERMKSALRADREENARQHWMQSGIVKISEVLAGQEDPCEIASISIGVISEWVGAAAGCFYAREGAGTQAIYVLLGTYAYAGRKSLSNRFGLGEGIVGQAALEGKQILIQNVPDDYIRVVSGLGECIPRNVCVTPVVYEGEVLGIVEIATVGPLGEKEQIFLERITVNIATALEVARSRNVLRMHQEELQVSNRELQAQAAELERSEQALLAQQRSLEESNEELNVQMALVSQSEDRLRAQQQELEAINIELVTKNEQLKRRGQEIEEARNALAVQAEGLRLTSKYKSEFMANMSHELRTPLNSLLILARSLQENGTGNLTDEQIECATIIHDSGKDLLNLINDILDLSKIEAGQMRLSVSEVELEEICQALRAQFSHMAREKDLDFQINCCPGVPEIIHTDQQRLGQILKNLVGNALKFTHIGHVTLSIEKPGAGVHFESALLSTQACLAFHVSDTGIGIAEEMLHKVFEAFQQVESGDSRNYGGTGLGLSISYQIAQLLGAEIHVKSTQGEGSTFTLYLPIGPSVTSLEEKGSDLLSVARHDYALPNVVTSTLDTSDAEFPDDRDGITDTSQVILLIEDDLRFVKILQDCVRKRGFKTLVALSGEAGLLLAQRYQPAGVLLDIQLPRMDGWAVLANLKNQLHTRHIPVHIVSAMESSIDSRALGAIGHVTKPVSMEQLRDVLDQLEKVICEKEKHVLIVEDNDVVRQETARLISLGNVKISQVRTGEEAAAVLRTGSCDLVVLDLGLPDMQGLELLDMLRAEGLNLPPVIIYTVRELTVEEEKALRDHTTSIVVKDVRSQERLLDEVALFLHHVISDLPQEKKAMIRQVHESDEALQDKVVLLVEDDMRTLFAMSKLLSEHGVKALKAENGKKALELLEREPQIDMILMDMMMPVMDGYETLRLIRAQPHLAELPIIALTAKAMAEDRSKCIAAGATDYLSKPVDPGKLLSLMRVWMACDFKLNGGLS